MAKPKWVVAFGVCTCTGGFYDNYATVMGIDTILPVDVYIPGCPPRPEMVLDGLMKPNNVAKRGKCVGFGASEAGRWLQPPLACSVT
jgi:NADH:ubiquinone oxidoreductase subunit B-like Fe-S oxidoreductase